MFFTSQLLRIRCCCTLCCSGWNWGAVPHLLYLPWPFCAHCCTPQGTPQEHSFTPGHFLTPCGHLSDQSKPQVLGTRSRLSLLCSPPAKPLYHHWWNKGGVGFGWLQRPDIPSSVEGTTASGVSGHQNLIWTRMNRVSQGLESVFSASWTEWVLADIS